jgi:hypothetical protein
MFDGMFEHNAAGSNGINVSGRLALDNRGNILVMDIGKKRIVQLGSENLTFIREVVSTDRQLRYAARMSVDVMRRRIYLADNEISTMSRLSMSTKFGGKAGRLVIYEAKNLE